MTTVLHAPRREKSGTKPPADDDHSLVDLLNETRILLPGTEVFLGFLMTMPFTERFRVLDGVQRTVYLGTFFATLLALVCFVLPAAYHRIARPIHHKVRFKALVNVFLIAGLIPLSIAITLVAWLVTSIVAPTAALIGAALMAATIGCVWWVIPLARLHDRYPR